MKTIVSVSRRTDIPAFYTRWFMNRVRAGWCTYPNPMFPAKICTVDLTPESVAGFVFWTRNARPLLPYLNELRDRGYAYYILYTVVNYPRELDPRSPSPEHAAETMRRLCNRLGPDPVTWRYDPIILNARGLSPAWHRENFARLLELLAPSTATVVLSIVDPYRKTTRRMGNTGDGVVYDPEEYTALLAALARQARERGLAVQSCAETTVDIPDITPGPCVDADLRARLSGEKVSRARHRHRPGCLCHRSVDIAVNNTCGFGCRYCYATANHTRALKTLRAHDPNAPSLA